MRRIPDFWARAAAGHTEACRQGKQSRASAHGLELNQSPSQPHRTAGQHGWKGHCGKEVCGALNAQEREQLHPLI
jgi:hypothetical protein